MTETETASIGEEETQDMSPEKEAIFFQSPATNGAPEMEHLSMLISTHTKELHEVAEDSRVPRDALNQTQSVKIACNPWIMEGESKADAESGLIKQPLYRKIPRSCTCCWFKVGPFYRQGIMNFVASLSGFAVGTIFAYPAVALARWEDADVKFSTSQITWFVSTPMVVSVVMSVVAGLVVERLGVRLCLVIGTLVLGLTWIMIAQATHFRILLIARIIQGFVASVYLVLSAVYPVEVSQVRWRGIMMGVAEAMVMLGAFLTYLGGLVLLPEPLAYTFIGVLVPQLILFFFLRESPLWLARRDRKDDIVDSLMCLRGHGVDIKPELEHIQTSVYTEKIQRPTAAEQLLLLRKPIYLKPLTLCILILLFKELTGQYAALTYTVKMFRMAGSSLDPYWCAVVMGAARFLPCFLSWVLIERLPRRYLLSSCMGMASIALATLGIFLWVWSDAENGLGPHKGWAPIVCLSIFTLAYGIGVGPISWTMVAELLPSQVRNVGVGIANACYSIFVSLVGFSFPFIVEAVGVHGVFIAYSLCSMCGVIFVLTFLPETRGRSFSDIQMNFGTSNERATVL